MSLIKAVYGAWDDNCYVDLATADVLIQSNILFYDPWLKAAAFDETSGSDYPLQERALIQGARDINSRNWKGEKFWPQQAMAFPRNAIDTYWQVYAGSAPDQSYYTFLGSDPFQLLMKGRVQRACAFQALWWLKNNGEMPYREDEMRGVRAGGRAMRFSDSWQQQEPSHVLCPEAMDELRSYWATGPRVMRGGASPIAYPE